MILNSVLKVFSPKRSRKDDQVSTGLDSNIQVVRKDYDGIASSLMERYAQFRNECRRERIETEKARSWKNTGNHKMLANDSGLYVLRDESGRIVKTRDAMRRVREFRYDENGELEVNKFGVWNKIPNGRISESGTLIWRSNERETYECLDGTVICIAFNNESLIAHNEKSGEEVSITMNGDVRHVVRQDGKERFRCFRQARLALEVESFQNPIELEIKTMAGCQNLSAIARVEKDFVEGMLSKTSYSFCDIANNQRSIKICLDLPSGELHLANVQKLENFYKQGALCETVYELSEPVTISRDKGGALSLIRGISKVKSFQIREGVTAVVFIDKCGDENLFFPQV